MSIGRAALFVLAIVFSAVMTSAAFAGCCGLCGACAAPSAAIVFAQPVAPMPPPPPPPVAVTWGTGCGCHRSVVYLAPPVQPTVIAPAPIYVVDQGPDYTGPGIMVPYHTWAPNAGAVAPGAYPYLPGYAYPAPGPRFAYGGRRYYHRPMRPLHVRD